MQGHAPKNAGLALFLLFFYLRSLCTVFLRKRWSLWSLLLGAFGLKETLSFLKGNSDTLLKCLKRAVAALEEYKRCNRLEPSHRDRNDEVPLARQQRWKPLPNGLIKVNWDAANNVKEGCIGLGAVARGCRGEFLGARCEMKPIVVDAKMAESMAALWAVLFCKAANFSDVIFERDSAQVVAELSSSPPYLSKNGHFNEKHRTGNPMLPICKICSCPLGM
jgi:hypothetical protein